MGMSRTRHSTMWREYQKVCTHSANSITLINFWLIISSINANGICLCLTGLMAKSLNVHTSTWSSWLANWVTDSCQFQIDLSPQTCHSPAPGERTPQSHVHPDCTLCDSGPIYWGCCSTLKSSINYILYSYSGATGGNLVTFMPCVKSHLQSAGASLISNVCINNTLIC